MAKKKKDRRSKSIFRYLRKGGESKPPTDDFNDYLAFFDEYLWHGQKKMADIALRIFNEEEESEWPVAVYSSGHATGKTWSLSRLAFFLALKYANGGGVEVVLLSPNKRITKTQMYRELKRCAERHQTYESVWITDEQITIGQSSITPVAFQQGGTGNSLQGYHGTDGTIFIVDEAAEFPKAVLQAAYSCASGHRGLIVLSGNPISLNKDADNALIYAMRVIPKSNLYNLCSGDHPNVQQKRTVIKGAVSWSYTANVVDEHSILYARDGECVHDGLNWDDSMEGATITVGRKTGAVTKLTFDTRKFKRGDVVLADNQACRRVFGIVVKQGAVNSIVSPFMFDNHSPELDHFYQKASQVKPATVSIGVDVARGGGDSGKIIAVFHYDDQDYVAVCATLQNASTEVYCEEICKVVRFFHNNGVRSSALAIDGTGGYGSGVVDTMKGIIAGTYTVDSIEYQNLTWFSQNRSINIKVIDFLFSVGCKSDADKKRYKNAVSLFAYKMKIRTQTTRLYTYAFSEKDKTHCLNRKAFTVGNKYVLQPKKQHKKAFGESPDSFDAYLLSYVAGESLDGMQALYDSSEALQRKSARTMRPKRLTGIPTKQFGKAIKAVKAIPIKPKKSTR